jgi:Sugar (and other) transporter
MFTGLIFVLSWSNYESPRYLIKRGKVEHAVANMARIRHLPPGNEYVLKETGEIQNQLAEEQEATMGQGFRDILREIFPMPDNFYRIYLGLGSQWSRAQPITIYAPDFFVLFGTKGQNVSSALNFSIS